MQPVSNWVIELNAHFKLDALAPSSKLCQNWLHHWRDTLYLHAAVHRSCQHHPNCLGTNMTVSVRLRATFEHISKHTCKHVVHSPALGKMSSVLIQNYLGFSTFTGLWWHLNNVNEIKETADVIWVKLSLICQPDISSSDSEDTKPHIIIIVIWAVCFKSSDIWAPMKNCLLADSFRRPRA